MDADRLRVAEPSLGEIDVTDFFLEHQLFLLFLVVAVGYPVGRIAIRGTSLGVAAVLFAGLAIGAFDERIALPAILYQLGLVLFVYTIGLTNGRAFFASFRRRGLRDSGFAVAMIAFAAAIAVGLRFALDLRPTFTAGMFSGAMTNTPSLAAELEYVKAYASGADLEQQLAEPVVGYSVAYPFGVLGVILALLLAQRLWRIDYRREAERVEEAAAPPAPLRNQSIRITQPAAGALPLRDLIEREDWTVVFGRLQRDGRVSLATGETALQVGDTVSIVGSDEEIALVSAKIGEPVSTRLELDRSQYDFRRIFVSNPDAIGRRLREIRLPSRFDAAITRVRRGDTEFLPTGETVLHPGDRVRVVAPESSMGAVTRFFGDSYRAVSEIDVPTFSLGLALGLLVGAVPIPFPGGVDIELGLAGGPLIVALILGALDRTGPLHWGLAYSAAVTLRQFGLVLFLAGIGTGAGYSFVTTLGNGDGVRLLIGGAVVTFTTTLLTVWVGYKLLAIPMGLLAGMVAGVQTQPAVLGFALEQSKDELPNAGYAAVFPVATIAKIVIAQVLLAALT